MVIFISGLLLVFFHFTNTQLKSFPGIGIEMVNQTINQPLLLSIAVIEFAIITVSCSYILFHRSKENTTIKLGIKLAGAILILAMTTIEASSNPYFHFYNCVPFFVLIATCVLIGFLLSKKVNSKNTSGV